MSNGCSELIEIIRGEIAARGPISFARFMQLALYEPRWGYYSSGRAAIGRAGDFFTNVSIGPLFGRLLAAQFNQVWQSLGRPAPFALVEQGAHDGAFACDVLRELERNLPEFFKACHYTIIEPFPVWRYWQQKQLTAFSGKVRWVATIDEIEPFVGVHFSNELFDSLPVHLFVAELGANGTLLWKERRVDFKSGRFNFVAAPVDEDGLRNQLGSAGSVAAGFTTELNLGGPALMRKIVARLEGGIVLSIDYGLSPATFPGLQHRDGSLQVRSQHTKLSSPFEKVGLADISAHVRWSSLAEVGRCAGLRVGLTDQHHFFSGIISQLFARAFDDSEKRALQTLLHPEMLGCSFQSLALTRNIPDTLAGFCLARPADRIT